MCLRFDGLLALGLLLRLLLRAGDPASFVERGVDLPESRCWDDARAESPLLAADALLLLASLVVLSRWPPCWPYPYKRSMFTVMSGSMSGFE